MTRKTRADAQNFGVAPLHPGFEIVADNMHSYDSFRNGVIWDQSVNLLSTS
jgi:hypothetical protein